VEGVRMYKLNIKKDGKEIRIRIFSNINELNIYRKQINNNPLGIYYEVSS